MGHHIDDQGRFQSDKYPDLAPDNIVVSLKDRAARRSLYQLATDYSYIDPDLSRDIFARLETLYPRG